MDIDTEKQRLARRFKVSTLVILRRMHDAGGLTRDQFWEVYGAEVARLKDIPRGSGGNFHLTQPVRASKRFTTALVASTLEGFTPFTEAFRLLGIRKSGTFHGLARSLGVNT